MSWYKVTVLIATIIACGAAVACLSPKPYVFPGLFLTWLAGLVATQLLDPDASTRR